MAYMCHLSGDWASALHELLRAQLAAPPRSEMEVPGSPEPLLWAPGPLRAQYQLHKDSMTQALQVNIMLSAAGRNESCSSSAAQRSMPACRASFPPMEVDARQCDSQKCLPTMAARKWSERRVFGRRSRCQGWSC